MVMYALLHEFLKKGEKSHQKILEVLGKARQHLNRPIMGGLDHSNNNST